MQKLITYFKNESFLITVIFIFALLLRLTLLGTEYWASPDSIEYINVAQNIIHGNGLTQSIKWHFFDNAPVTTSVFKGRPILTPLIFAGLFYIHNNVYTIQTFLLILGAVNCVVFFLLARRFLNTQISFLVAVVAALNPNLLIANRLVLSEPIFTFFVLCFFILFFKKNKTYFSYIFLGILPALAYLTRFEGFFLLFLLPFMKERKIYLLAVSAGFFILCTLPYFWGNFLVNHSPFYSYNTYHFRVYHFWDGMWDGFGRKFPTAGEFIKNNFLWTLKTNYTITLFNLKTIFGFGFLSFLSLGYLIFLKNFKKEFAPFFTFSALTIFLLSIIWAGFTEPERHFSTIYFLLLIPLFSLFNSSWKKIMLILTILTILVYIGLDIHRIYWARFTEPVSDNHGLTNKKDVYEWIIKNTPENAIIASDNPWMVYLKTNHPAVIFSPNVENRGLLNEFIQQYNISYLISDITLKTRKSIFSSNGATIYCGTDCK